MGRRPGPTSGGRNPFGPPSFPQPSGMGGGGDMAPADFTLRDPTAAAAADPAAPSLSNPETQSALEEARLRERKARGRAATILTGNSSNLAGGASLRRTLLGA